MNDDDDTSWWLLLLTFLWLLPTPQQRDGRIPYHPFRVVFGVLALFFGGAFLVGASMYVVGVVSAAPTTLQGRVVSVADGDTLTLLVGREQHRIRLANIDAPESGQAFGSRAKQALSDLCFGDTAAIVRVQDRDRYDRIVGRVECRGVAVNAALVEQGLAWVYTQHNRDLRLPALEAKARRERRGLWSEPNPTPPWEWRRSRRR